MTLVEILNDPTKKNSVVADGVGLIESEVASKSGMRGYALKAGYKTVKKIRPGIISAALGALLPEFAPAVDPYYAKGRETGDVQGYFRANAPEIADALLSVTDARAERANNRVMKRAYSGLRGQAKSHVEDAMPGLAGLIAKHVG